MKRHWAFAVLIAITQSARAGELDGEMLKGLKTLSVLVEFPGAPVLNAGVDYAQLKTDVEVRLRRSGIKVAETKASKDRYLYVQIGGVKNKADIWGYSVRVSLMEGVTVLRNKQFTLSETWNQSMVGTSNEAHLYPEIREAVDDFVDQFTNNYLAANQ